MNQTRDWTIRSLEALDDLLPHGFGEALLIRRDGTKRVLTHYDPEVECVREAIDALRPMDQGPSPPYVFNNDTLSKGVTLYKDGGAMELRFYASGSEPVIRVTPTQTFVRGIKVNAGQEEAQAVFEGLQEFLNGIR